MKTIFFVEDDESLQDIAGLVFTAPEFAIRIFSSAEEMLKEHNCPHVYVLDKQLPGMDGLELCRILKAGTRTRSIPVVMVSADPDIKFLAASAGAEAALEKPFSIYDMHDLVTNAVKQVS